MATDKDADKEKDQAGAEGEATEGGKPKSRFAFLLARKKLLMIAAPVLLLLVGGGGYFFLFAGGEETAGESAEAGAHGEGAAGGHGAGEAHPVFVEVPDILVNVASGGEKPAFLKLAVSLEIENADETTAAQLEPIMPRVVDQMQVYLRELRVEDLNGSGAMFRLKEEMIRRVNLAIEPIRVKNVLFREMIIQ